MKKIIAFIISIALVFTIMPTVDTQAKKQIIHRRILNGSDYTDSSKLAAKLNEVFRGKIGLYSAGREVKAPVGSSKVNEYNMFGVVNGRTGEVTSGWQCYIYANAVYNALFNESIGHGDSLLHSKKVISKGGKSLSYRKLKKAGVRCGAYVRVASNYGGCYNGNGGHSFIILSYDKEGIAYLEGNANNSGLVCATECSWDEFNYHMLSKFSRKVCYVIQPVKSYYNEVYYTPEKVSLSRIKKTESNKVKLKWKKMGNVEGYEIQYSTDKGFDENTDTKKAKSSAKSKTITKLEHGETYYFKVRAYNKKEKSTIYGNWSQIRKVKISKENKKEENILEETSKTENKKEEVVVDNIPSVKADELETTTVSTESSDTIIESKNTILQ